MELEKCRIKLDSPQNIYFAGQQINGEVCLSLDKKTKIKGIKVNIIGRYKCKWIQFAKPNTTPHEKKTSLVYSTTKNILFLEKYIFGSDTGTALEFLQREHNFIFQFDLDPNLKSSFIGKYGSVKYKIKVTIIKPWSFDEKYEKPLSIVLYKLPPTIRYVTPVNIKSQNIGLIGGGPIHLTAHLHSSYVIRGKELLINVTIDNMSNVHVEKLKFTIFQSIKYYRIDIIDCQREEINALVKKETGGVQKKTKRSFAYELQMPCCLPTDDQMGLPVRITYYVQVKVLLSGLHKNLMASLPFEVCSFETVAQEDTVVAFYPGTHDPTPSNLSIGSPSHSSYCSDTSSINSTASDLSTITLSPQNSSLFTRDSFASTSSSVRSSLRNSIGFQLQNQPMNNSYPPRNNPQALAQNFETSSPQFVPRIPPVQAQYSNDLPPSYEELFGDISQIDPNIIQKATAPPLSP